MSYLPDNVTDCITEAIITIEKGSLISGDLITNYSFRNLPMVSYDTANNEARKWIFEYSRILKLMNIVHDYVFRVSEILEKAETLDDEERKKSKGAD